MEMNHKLTVDEMWSCVKGEDTHWGIEGYEVPKKYFDYKQMQWGRKIGEIQKDKRKHWPPNDWAKDPETDKPIPPKRPNYLDQVYKWATSYYDANKVEEVKEKLVDRGHPYEYPTKIDVKKVPNRRQEFLDKEEKKKQFKAELSEVPEWKQDAIESIKEKIKEDEERAKQQAKEKATGRKTIPQCDRITIVADAEHVGEKLPFYNTFVKPGEEDDENEDEDGRKVKKKRKLFYPDKNPIWNKAPAWKYPKKNTEPNSYAQTRDDLQKEKIDALLEAKPQNLTVDVSKSYNQVKNKGKNYFQYKKPTDNTQVEAYQNYQENNPKVYPGPQHYFKTLPWSKPKRKKNDDEEEGEKDDDDEDKKKIVPREKTDKRIYKPMRKSVY